MNRAVIRFIMAPGLALGLTIGLAAPTLAQGTPPTTGQAQQLAVEGLSKLLDALNVFVKSVPQYAAPEVLPNGDIILRRLNPPAPEKPSEPEADQTRI